MKKAVKKLVVKSASKLDVKKGINVSVAAKKIASRETVAQKALRLLMPVPAGDWITNVFTDQSGKCCAIGHYMRLKSKNSKN